MGKQDTPTNFQRLSYLLMPEGSLRRDIITLPARVITILLSEGIFGIIERFVIRFGLWSHSGFAPPIFIYQMGKVGSKSIWDSLTKFFIAQRKVQPVIHAHVLCNLNEIEVGLKRERSNPATSTAHIQVSKKTIQWMSKRPDEIWNVITLVRDPIARNIGAFFQNFHEFIPDWQERYERGKLTIEEIQQVFLKAHSIHNAPVVWFDEQLKPLFGVDVFSSSFPIEIGYKIYDNSPRARVLLIRLEDLNRVAPQAIKDFLDIDSFQLTSTNIGEDKYYAEAYQKFKRVPLPEEYIQEIYSIKLAKHFYTPDELNLFANRWRGKTS